MLPHLHSWSIHLDFNFWNLHAILGVVYSNVTIDDIGWGVVKKSWKIAFVIFECSPTRCLFLTGVSPAERQNVTDSLFYSLQLLRQVCRISIFPYDNVACIWCIWVHLAAYNSIWVHSLVGSKQGSSKPLADTILRLPLQANRDNNHYLPFYKLSS